MRHCQVHSHSTTTDKKGVFDVIECLDWVNVLALTHNDEVVLVRQYRQGTDAVTMELPGGAVHRGEDPLLGAKRELEEETGGVAREWIKLGHSDVNPAFMENRCHYFLAKGIELVKEQSLDPQEEIEIVKVPLRDVPGMFQRGEITHSLTHAAFCFFFATDLFPAGKNDPLP
ncbi:MAG: hypothetical protein A2X86_01445 [Bdellovibrionales bacterium GWA2_49_15]|nr:MAG: hypothetical protein A2X86_01445 [Bdellovibrionales bacterium GWA2_49_15]